MAQPITLAPYTDGGETDLEAIYKLLKLGDAIDKGYDEKYGIASKLLLGDLKIRDVTIDALTKDDLRAKLNDAQAVINRNIQIRFELWRRDALSRAGLPYQYAPIALIILLSTPHSQKDFSNLQKKQNYMARVYTELDKMRDTPVRVRRGGATSDYTLGGLIDKVWPVDREEMRPLQAGSKVIINDTQYLTARAFGAPLLAWIKTAGQGEFDASALEFRTAGTPQPTNVQPSPSVPEEPTTKATTTGPPSSQSTVEPAKPPQPSNQPPQTHQPETPTSTPSRTQKSTSATQALLESKQEEIDDLKRQLAEMRNSAEQMKTKHAKTEQKLKSESDSLKLTIEELQAEADEFKRNIKQLGEEKKAAENERTEARDQITVLTNQLKTANEKNTAQTEQIEKLQLARGDASETEQQLASLEALPVLHIAKLTESVAVDDTTKLADVPWNTRHLMKVLHGDSVDLFNDILENYNSILAAPVHRIVQDTKAGRWKVDTDTASFAVTYKGVFHGFYMEKDVEQLLDAANAGGGSGATASLTLGSEQLIKQDQFRRLASGQYGTNRVRATFLDAHDRVTGIIELARLAVQQTPDARRYLVADLGDAETALQTRLGGTAIPRQGRVELSAYDRGVLTKEDKMAYNITDNGTQALTGRDSLRLYSTALSADTARLDMLVLSY